MYLTRLMAVDYTSVSKLCALHNLEFLAGAAAVPSNPCATCGRMLRTSP